METNQLTLVPSVSNRSSNQLFTDLDVTMETGQKLSVSWVPLVQGKTTLTEILLGQQANLPTISYFENAETCDCWFTLLVLCAPAKSSSWNYLKVSEMLVFPCGPSSERSGKLTKKHHCRDNGWFRVDGICKQEDFRAFWGQKNAVSPLVSSFLALVLTFYPWWAVFGLGCP